MGEIIREYGKLLLTMLVLLLAVSLLFASGDSGENLLLARMGRTFSDVEESEMKAGEHLELKDYKEKQKTREVSIWQRLSVNARYTLFDFVKINGSIGEYTEDGKKRYIKIEKIRNENGDEVKDGIYDPKERTVVFQLPGVYRAYIRVRDEEGISSSGWYGIGVMAGNGACPKATDGIHKYHTVLKGASCITNGYQLHTCEYCNDTYRNGSSEKTGHDYQETIITEAGCEKNGMLRKTCKVCGDKVDQEIEKYGHDLPSEKTGAIYVCSQYSANSKIFQFVGAFGYTVASLDYRDVCTGCGATNYHYWCLTNLNYMFTLGQDLGGTRHCSHYFCKRCGKNVDQLMQ